MFGYLLATKSQAVPYKHSSSRLAAQQAMKTHVVPVFYGTIPGLQGIKTWRTTVGRRRIKRNKKKEEDEEATTCVYRLAAYNSHGMLVRELVRNAALFHGSLTFH